MCHGTKLAYCARFDQLPEAMKCLSPTIFVAVPRVYEKVRQAVERKSGDVKPGDEFGHSTRLLLVDKLGVIRASFEGMADDQFPEGEEHFKSGLTRLKEGARALAKE